MTTTTDYTYYLFLGQYAPQAGTTTAVILSHNYNGAANDLIFTGSTLTANGAGAWHERFKWTADTDITYSGFTTPDGGPIIEIAPPYPGATPAYYALSNTLYTTFTPVADASFACFVSGTRIDTPAGERNVETLQPGDQVTLARGGSADIIWIGWRTLPNPEYGARAIRIRAHSFAPGQPRRDLYLSPEHAIFRAGILVPVKALINGTSIAPVDLGPIRYFHVLLEQHDIILAEGLACESLLDVQDPVTFANTDTAPPSLAFLRPAAAIHTQGPCVELVRAQVSAREKQAVLF